MAPIWAKDMKISTKPKNTEVSDCDDVRKQWLTGCHAYNTPSDCFGKTVI